MGRCLPCSRKIFAAKNSETEKRNPDARIISHPECQQPILIVSDFIGSTAALLNFSKKDSTQKYIVATESGILYQMKLASPQKTFIPAPPIDSTCGCNDCEFMKLITLEKVYRSLKEEKFEITLSSDIINLAVKPIKKMLEISASAGLFKR